MPTRVVLIDDNPQDRLLAKRALAAEFPDLDVTEVRDQPEFDQVVRRLDADVIVTDYQLRWTDGLKVLAAVRQGGGDMPVVMFTHTGSEEIAAEGLRAGLADYIIKTPTHYGRLAHAVHLAIRNAVAARNERDARVREREALRTAEEALRVKNEFLATLSHELRTPLNAISGWVQIVKSIPEPDRINRGLIAIERNTAALQRLIEDLVDMSRMVTGRLTLQVRPTDIRKVVDAALDAVRPAAHVKRVAIHLTAPAILEPVAADPDRLQQIAWNLLSNAVKFTPDGGRVDIDLRAAGSSIELVVADTGPGIRADFLPRVFEPFAQQDAGTTRAHGGLGLGMAIVRHLVEAHAGSVSVTSTEGEGAVFTVRIPLAETLADGDESSPSKASRARLDGVSVLVVDDDADAREVLGQTLEDEGAVVTLACSAAEAYEQLTTHVPDVLVCDIGMPGEDGLTFIGRVRADCRMDLASVPAVAVTAYARDQDRLRTLEAGFQFHLTKPVAATELVGTVGFLAKRSSERKT